MNSKYKCQKEEMTDNNSLYVHVAKNLPLHLHIDRSRDMTTEIVGDNHNYIHLGIKNVPWVPPPGKSTHGRRINLMNDDGNKRIFTHDKTRPIPSARSINRPNLKSTDHFRFDKMIDDSDDHNQEYIAPMGDIMHSASPSICQKPDYTCLTSLRRPLTSPPAIETSKEVNFSGIDDWALKIEHSVDLISSATRNMVRNGDPLTCIWDNKTFETIVSQTELIRKAAHELFIHSARINAEKELRTKETEILEAQHRCEVEILKTELEKSKIEVKQANESIAMHERDRRQAKTVQASLEILKGHLQLQLKNKESECSRLSTQLHFLEAKCIQEVENAQSRVQGCDKHEAHLRGKLDMVKQAARGQKLRAERAEHRLGELERLIEKREQLITELQNSLESVSGEAKFRRLEPEIRKLEELTEKLADMDKKTTDTQNLVRRRLGDEDHKDKEVAFLEKENNTLREKVTNYETRLVSTEHEVKTLQFALAQTESRLQEYRSESEAHWKHLQPMPPEKQYQTGEGKCAVQKPFDELDRITADRPTNGNEAQVKISKPSEVVNSNSHNMRTAHLDDDRYRLLESTVNDLRTQLALNRRDGEETDREHTSRITDLRAQLMQSDSANRSLQAYLTFLKRSYTSIFDGGEADLTNAMTLITQLPPQTTTTTTAKNNVTIEANAS